MSCRGTVLLFVFWKYCTNSDSLVPAVYTSVLTVLCIVVLMQSPEDVLRALGSKFGVSYLV
jgi:hypothetical protein